MIGLIKAIGRVIRNIIVGYAIILVCIVADICSTAYMCIGVISHSNRWWRVAIAKDQSFNAATGGSEDETLSSRAARAEARGDRWGCVLCKFLGYIDKDHCKKSLGQ